MSNYNYAKQWLKNSDQPLAMASLKYLKLVRQVEIPLPKYIGLTLYATYRGIEGLLSSLTRLFIWTPLLKGRLRACGKNLYLYGGLPFISGALDIHLGNNCRISGQTTFTGRTSSTSLPELHIADNVDIGWMTTIAVGQRVEIGHNVRIAGRALLAGYPGHPISSADRAAGLADTDDQIGDIVLEHDVWLATGVTVLAGVCIGSGTIVASGSVVTKNLPSNVLAAGIPAKVIRSLEHAQGEEHVA